jgi:hypothetical protein
MAADDPQIGARRPLPQKRSCCQDDAGYHLPSLWLS